MALQLTNEEKELFDKEITSAKEDIIMPLKKKIVKKKADYKPIKIGEVRSSTTHDESGNLIVKKHKTWREHNAWLDTFRAKIITGKGDK